MVASSVAHYGQLGACGNFVFLGQIQEVDEIWVRLTKLLVLKMIGKHQDHLSLHREKTDKQTSNTRIQHNSIWFLQQLETRMGTFKTPFLTVEFFTQLCRLLSYQVEVLRLSLEVSYKLGKDLQVQTTHSRTSIFQIEIPIIAHILLFLSRKESNIWDIDSYQERNPTISSYI